MLRSTVCLVLLLAGVQAQLPEGWRTYTDPQKRFTFGYPSVFGIAEAGSDDGVGDRVASIRFRSVIGTDVVLSRGPVTVERQALGGLHDVYARQVIPDNQINPILAAIAPVTVDNFCTLLGRADHVVRPGALSEKALQLARATDAMGNVQPKVIACTRKDNTITFDKEAALAPGQVRRRVYGAIRFLSAPYSAIQAVGFGPAPSDDMLASLTTLVNSFNVTR